MTRPLKVYGVNTYLTGVSEQVRAVVAAPSKRAAAEAMGTTVSHLTRQGDVTENEIEVRYAMSEPGTVFYQPIRGLYSAEYQRWTPKSQGPDHA